MYHIDKIFPCMVWNYNHKVFGVKPSESTSKHFEHRALEVWSALYPNKPFGSKNKNISSYSLAAMLYAELELKKKVDWRMVLTKNKEDKTKYSERDVPNNFSTFQQSVEVGPALPAANRSTSRAMKIIRNKDSTAKAIRLAKSESKFKEIEATNASKKLDTSLPRLEVDI
jgi:hypothetical protein